MVIEFLSRERIRERIRFLLSHQVCQGTRRFKLRIFSPIIHEVAISNNPRDTIVRRLRRLACREGSIITVAVNEKESEKDMDLRKLLKELENAGVRVHYLRKLHAKAVLLESERDQALLISSSNLTKSGLYEQIEMGLYIQNEPELTSVVDSAKEYMNQLLGGEER